MEQNSNFAVVKVAQIMSSMEEFVLSMGQRSNYAAVKDALIKSSREDCV